MCKDYNPKQAECSVALTRLYFLNGIYEKASNELERLLQNGHQDRVMLNILDVGDCSIPHTAIEMLILKAKNGLLSLIEAKYIVLLVSVVLSLFILLSLSYLSPNFRDI